MLADFKLNPFLCFGGLVVKLLWIKNTLKRRSKAVNLSKLTAFYCSGEGKERRCSELQSNYFESVVT